MNDTPLMRQMDALLKKHRGTPEGQGASPLPVQAIGAPPMAWLPVLTDVVERGTPPTPPVSMDAAPPTAAVAPPGPPPATILPAVYAAPVADMLARQLMSELAPRLSEVMEKQVAAELRRNLDQTVATLLAQLNVNVREIVREAVAEKLKQPRDP